MESKWLILFGREGLRVLRVFFVYFAVILFSSYANFGIM